MMKMNRRRDYRYCHKDRKSLSDVRYVRHQSIGYVMHLRYGSKWALNNENDCHNWLPSVCIAVVVVVVDVRYDYGID
jgi:hypothetical protein